MSGVDTRRTGNERGRYDRSITMSSKAQLSALVERVVDGDRSAFATIDDELSVSTWAVTTDPIVATA